MNQKTKPASKAPSAEERALDGARLCLREWAKVQPGEQVLILKDLGDYVEPAVVQTFVKAIEEFGAVPTEMSCAMFNPRNVEPPAPVAKALQATDVVLFFSRFPALIHCKSGKRAMLEYGLRIVPIIANTMEILGSEWAHFPVDLLMLLHRKSTAPFFKNKAVRVTSTNGTDISGLVPEAISTIDRERLFPGLGWHGMWPGEVGPCMTPMRNMNGTVVVDALPGFPGFLKEKMRVEIKDNVVQSISGGPEAKWFEKFMGDSVKAGSDANIIHELQWGVNPKGDIHRGLLNCLDDEVEISRVARTMHFGFGSGQRGFHWDVLILDHFDIVVGGNITIYKDGRLTFLDEPDVRQLAAKYGDPDEVLAEHTPLASLRVGEGH